MELVLRRRSAGNHAAAHLGSSLDRTGFQWLIVAAFLAAWAYYMLVMFRGQRLAAMGRDLRPAGSFQTPYRRTIWASRLYLSWFVPWFVVLMILVSFSLFR